MWSADVLLAIRSAVTTEDGRLQFIDQKMPWGSRTRMAHTAALLGLLAVSPVRVAQSVFNGTWRPDPQTFSPTRKPDAIELVNGIYEGRTCAPPCRVRADGTDQQITGNPRLDSLRITVINNRTIRRVAQKDGKVVKISRWSVAVDGKTIHVRFDDTHGHVQEQDGRKVE